MFQVINLIVIFVFLIISLLTIGAPIEWFRKMAVHLRKVHCYQNIEAV